MDDSPDFTKLKVAELSKILKARGLNTKGCKSVLIRRCRDSFSRERTIRKLFNFNDYATNFDNREANPAAEHSGSSRTKLEEESTATLTRGMKTKLSDPKEIPMEIEDITHPASKGKKMTKLTNRNVKESLGCGKRVLFKDPLVSENKKIIKLKQPQFSAKERLEMRRKKFGKLSKYGSLLFKEEEMSVSVLKQREKRFGVCTSSELMKIKNAEKLEKRKQRFGIGSFQ